MTGFSPSEGGRKKAGGSLEAAFDFGRLKSGWAAADADQRMLFGFALARRAVMRILEIEGYAFTPEQFSYWLAGAARLDEQPFRFARPARLVLEAVIGELAISRCDEVANGARLLERIAMPIPDEGDYGDIQQCYDALKAATGLLARARFACGDGPAGFVSRVTSACEIARKSAIFATREGEMAVIEVWGNRIVADRPVERAVNWALDLGAGALLAEAIPGLPPLPCPGLFDRSFLTAPLDEDSPRQEMAESAEALLGRIWARVAAMARELADLLDVAVGAQRRRVFCSATVSRNSRLPAMVGLLGVAPELRSAQLEKALGVSRIGLRVIEKSGIDEGWLSIHKTLGVKFIGLAGSEFRTGPASPAPESSAFYVAPDREQDLDDAIAFADGVLGRRGMDEDEEVAGTLDLDAEYDEGDDLPAWV